MREIRAILWGIGSMGAGIGRDLLQNKQGVSIVGAIDTDPNKIRKDLGTVLGTGEKIGVTVSDDPDSVLKQQADIVFLSTSSFTREVFPCLEKIIASKKNVITTAEEMADPSASEQELAVTIDLLAREHGVTVLGTGVNPGFVLDSLIITLSGACQTVERIKASRVNDLSPFGPTVMKTQGVGATPEEFYKGVQDGNIVGHIGFKESLSLIARALGWELDRVEESKEPIISKVLRTTEHVRIEAGNVAGCKHIARGFMGAREVITLEHPQQVHPHLENVETGDYITIEGTPTISWRDENEIPGGIGTIAVAVNMLPHVINATPGLKTMLDLPMVSAHTGDLRKKIYKLD